MSTQDQRRTECHECVTGITECLLVIEAAPENRTTGDTWRSIAALARQIEHRAAEQYRKFDNSG